VLWCSGPLPAKAETSLERLEEGPGRNRPVSLASDLRPSSRHVEADLGVTEQVGRVAPREGDDVSAGDRARARLLDCALGHVDHLVASQAGVVLAWGSPASGPAERTHHSPARTDRLLTWSV
jgi:hypothetical protein